MKTLNKLAITSFLLGAGISASAQFSELWNARYNGDANGLDQANAVATDRRGNTYTTGKSTEITGGINIVTIKYSSAGTQLWRHGTTAPQA